MFLYSISAVRTRLDIVFIMVFTTFNTNLIFTAATLSKTFLFIIASIADFLVR